METTNLILIIFVILTSITISGCIDENNEVIKPTDYNTPIKTIYIEEYNQTSKVGDIYFIHDDERNVSCWILIQNTGKNGEGGGISCIPDWQMTTENS